MENTRIERTHSLYDPSFEHDNCGIGAVVNIKGEKSHRVVDDALTIVETLEHRAGKDADGKTGDGVGILSQVPHPFFIKAAAEIGIRLPANAITAWECSSSPGRSWRATRHARCSRSSPKRKG